MKPNGMPPRPQPTVLPLTEEAYNKQFTIQFSRRELTVVFNLIHQNEWRIPDARIMIGIIDKINGPVTALTNQDYKQPENVPTPKEEPVLTVDPKEN
jgi:hypothetical protein